MSEARLTRSTTDRMIAGVCGGLANYLETDPVFVRLAFVVLLLASGVGFPLYLILWFVMPEEGDTADSGADIFQKNVNEMGDTVSTGLSRYGRGTTVGILLVLMGVFFLFQQLGWLNWFSGAIFWPLVIIGFGVYLLARRNQ